VKSPTLVVGSTACSTPAKHGGLPSKAAVLFLPTKTSRAFADQYLYWEIKT